MGVQIWLEATTRSVLGVGYVVSRHRSLARDLTYSRHCNVPAFLGCQIDVIASQLVKCAYPRPVVPVGRVLYQKA